jgi:hypothetical protein
MLGYDENEIGYTPDDIANLLHPDDLPVANAYLESYLLGASDEQYVSEQRMR